MCMNSQADSAYIQIHMLHTPRPTARIYRSTCCILPGRQRVYTDPHAAYSLANSAYIQIHMLHTPWQTARIYRSACCMNYLADVAYTQIHMRHELNNSCICMLLQCQKLNIILRWMYSRISDPISTYQTMARMKCCFKLHLMFIDIVFCKVKSLSQLFSLDH